MQSQAGSASGSTDLLARGIPIAGLALVVLGATVMLGWWLQSPMLVRLAPGYPPMSALTALGLAFSGAALAASATEEKKLWPAALAAIVALIAVTVLSQYFIGADLGLDRPFDSGWLDDERPYLGRMAPATAFALLLGGATLAAIHVASRHWLTLAIPLAAIVVIAVGAIALLAYVADLHLLLSGPAYARMAPLSAAGIVLLGVGLWGRWYLSPRFASILAERHDRRMLFTTILTVVGVTLIGAISSYGMLERQTSTLLKHSLELSLHDRVEVYHNSLQQGISAAAAIATQPGIRQELATLRTTANDDAALARLRGTLAGFTDIGFSAISMSDARGRQVQQTGNFASDPPLRAPINLARGAELIWSDGLALLRVRRTLTDAHGPLGVLTTEQPLPLLNHLFNYIGGLGETAEMVVCSSQTDSIRCFPTRLRPAVFDVPRRLQNQSLPIAFAIDGVTGVTATIDATGAHIIAAYGPIPLTGLGMVLSLSADEIYRPMARQFQVVLWLLAAFVLAAIAILWRQIRILTRTLTRAEDEAREASNRLRLREAMLNAVLQHSGDAVYLKDLAGRYLMINTIAARRIGRTPAEVIDRDDSMLWPDETAHALAEIDRQVRERDEPQSVEDTAPMLGGMRTYLHTRALYRDDAGRPIGLIGVARDITDRKRVEEIVRALSLIDDLTGLRSRRGFVTLAEAELSVVQRSGRSLYLIYADLNNMKDINDRLGYSEGDRALRDVAEILRRVFREPDIIARLANDEFAILMNAAADAEQQFLARLQQSIEEHNRVAQRAYELSLSIGVVRYDPTVHATLDALLADADISMFRTKQNRRATR